MANILPDLSKLDADQLRVLVAQLAASQKAPGKLTLKVSAKGALSIYGLGRWPITLYLSQFDTLKSQWQDVCKFVEANRSSFTTKE